MDIKPPRRPGPQNLPPNVGIPVQRRPRPSQVRPAASQNFNTEEVFDAKPQRASEDPSTKIPAPKRKKWLKVLIITLLSLLGAGLVALSIFWFWYQSQMNPADSNSQELVLVNIESGTAPNAIGDMLEEKGVIRSSSAFMIHTRLSGTQNRLQAGSYRLSPADTTPRIVEHLTDGNVDTFRLTFYPGATLVDNTNKPADQKIDVTNVLLRAGFDQSEISEALSKKYDHPLFHSKPESADLEGYIYGETYDFYSSSSVEDILVKIFDHFYEIIQQNNLEDRFKQQGLNLYQGITLASIIQRESGGDDKNQIAQVFLKRLDMDMVLGSDVTYQYIADKTGVDRDVNLDSPYNTRRYGGLPPGPIAVPGLASLKAVGEPASGDFLYFLSGDDDVTYFARTFEQHQANITNHCQKKCQIL